MDDRSAPNAAPGDPGSSGGVPPLEAGPVSGLLRHVWIDETGTWRSFVLNLTLVIVMVVSALYAGVFLNSRNAIEAELHNRASAIFDSIVLARRWSAGYGGVYVEKKPGMESNPYLRDPDIRTLDGKVYTLKNPALMTREISAIAERMGSFRFHITSLKLVNPGNAPDAWEEAALKSFEQGVKEATTREATDGSAWYRFMAPLRFEAACGNCHDGYREGDVRGGISIRFNIDTVEAQLATNRLGTILLFALTVIALMLVVYRIVGKLYRRLKTAEDRIHLLAITDVLTGVHNRRHALTRLDEESSRALRYGRGLGCIMLDLDHFKQINDQHGHAAGDTVLRAVGERMSAVLRSTDVIGRYGGEEFVVVLPELKLPDVTRVAEKLRHEIEDLAIDIGDGKTLKVTASLGVADIDGIHAQAGNEPAAASIALLKLADSALYRAKAGGRNRTEAPALPTDGTPLAQEPRPGP